MPDRDRPDSSFAPVRGRSLRPTPEEQQARHSDWRDPYDIDMAQLPMYIYDFGLTVSYDEDTGTALIDGRGMSVVGESLSGCLRQWIQLHNAQLPYTDSSDEI